MRIYTTNNLRKESKLCYCPCSTRFKRWSKLYGLCDVNGGSFNCDCKWYMTPNSLIDHLRMKMDKCIFHQIVYHYLESLYRPWWRFELPSMNAFASHYCFSGINSFDHNKALSLFHEHGQFSKRMYHIDEPARHIEFTHSYNYPSPVSRAKYKPNPSLQQSPGKNNTYPRRS